MESTWESKHGSATREEDLRDYHCVSRAEKKHVNDELTSSNLFHSTLHLAAVSGHLEKSQMENINPVNNYGEPPLHSAAVNGHLEKFQMENINPENNYGKPPLHPAVISGHMKNSKLQMEYINPKNNYGEPTLHSAAVNGHLEKFQMENINPENNYGKPPLHLADISGHLKNSKPNYGETPPHPKSPVSKYTSLKILTLNVCGLKSYGRIDQVRNLLIKYKIDVAVLTETEISHDMAKTFNIDGYKVFCPPHFTTGPRGKEAGLITLVSNFVNELNLEFLFMFYAVIEKQKSNFCTKVPA